MELATTPASAATTPVGPQKALEDAVDGFHGILTKEQRGRLVRLGAVRDAETVMIFTAQLDRENQLKKGRGVASRLISVLRSVQAFSSVVDTFVSSKPEFAALVWGSVKLSLLIAVNYTSYFEALSDLFMSFSNHCPRFTEYQALYPASTRLQKALCDFHASIVLCCKRVVEALQRPWQKQLANAFRQSFESEFMPFKNDVQRLAQEVSHEVKLAQALAYRQDQALQEAERAAASKQRLSLWRFMPEVGTHLDTIKRLQVQQATRKSREERLKILEWLSSHEYITPFREACKKRQCSTAEWIFETPEFIKWYDGTGSPVLWCSGKIGPGKTILCSNVINYVLAHKSADDHISFFQRWEDRESLKAETAIRSIIRQSVDMVSLPSTIETRLKELAQKHFVSVSEWTDLAREATKCSGALYIFIDGLDEPESTERRSLLKALKSLVHDAANLKIFITGRNSVHVDLKGRFASIEHVALSAENLAPDIDLYVQAAIQARVEEEDLVTSDQALLDDITQTLTQHADGMFLWVSFLIEEVCIASCDSEIRQFLRSLPKDLEETFSRALSRIVYRQKMADLVQKVFRWVAAAKRPLCLDELREGVSIEIGQEFSKPERLIREMSRIALWSENLLQVTEEGDRPVHFAHRTVCDFLVGSNIPQQLASFHVDLDEADHFAGEICVTYLHFNDFKTTLSQRMQSLQVNPVDIARTTIRSGLKSDDVTARLADFVFGFSKAGEAADVAPALASYHRAGVNTHSLHQSHPFLRYASEHWVSHSPKFDKDRSKTWDLWYLIVSQGHSLANRPWQHQPRYEGAKNDEDHLMLWWSHGMNHYALLEYSACRIPGGSLDHMDTLMEKSAREGDIEAIKIFFKLGSRRALFIIDLLVEASTYSQWQLVNLLLDPGAFNPDHNRSGLRRALQSAAKVGRQDIIRRLLLDDRANVDGEGPPYDGALRLAARDGHLEIVRGLLEASAHLDAVRFRTRWQTALHAASEGGHVSVVDCLLAQQSDVNSQAPLVPTHTALCQASKGGHVQIVKRLLEAGANANGTNSAGAAPLQMASGADPIWLARYVRAVSLWLADPGRGQDNPQRRFWQYDRARSRHSFPIQSGREAASEGSRLEIVEMLLAAGVDVKAYGAYLGLYSGTALAAALFAGRSQIVKRLLAAGADPNENLVADWTLLHAVSEAGHIELVEVLLTAGAHVDAVAGVSQRTALMEARSNGHEHVVEVLLAAGAI